MKIRGKLKRLIGAAAPTLGAVLGGPLGGMAGKFVADALGVDDERQALELLETDPEALLKLKQAELDFEARMEELDVDLAKVMAEDRAGARALAQAKGIWPQVVLSALFIAGYFVIVGLFFSSTLEVPMSDAFNVLMGVLTAAVPQILAFWFGSTSGSARKTEIIARNGSR